MSQIVRLHGGPGHQKHLTIADGLNHFHVVGDPAPIADVTDDEAAPVALEFRKGTYSRVGKTTDFEWDGWSG